MKIGTNKFGEIEINKEEIVEFIVGPYGFEELTDYVLLAEEDSSLFWLQSVEDEDLAFVVSEPWTFYEDYEFDLNDNVKEKLNLDNKEEVLVVNMITVPNNKPREMTMNLKAPIIINKDDKLAKQIILNEGDYPVKYKLLDDEEALA
ncbi:flagellar assembly protein FliW [Halanaerobacter jeridensis]|uniref:Flagellar assembly factor FliW n=1 Tax=Halanaerobacter jeridensis TaxID=706427 RepID=A0A938XTY5_9FIRM|nr:flagellar assembly factor FliW [Halanaerobacter jeridensis]